MPYGSLLADVVQSSTAATPPQFNDGNGTQIGTLCRAWVTFIGASAAIQGSFNVSSVTRNSTGDYRINFTNSLADGKYAAIGVTGSTNTIGYIGQSPYNFTNTASAASIVTFNTALNATADCNWVSFAAFR